MKMAAATTTTTQWNCSVCTYANPTKDLVCEMCASPRETTAAMAATGPSSTATATATATTSSMSSIMMTPSLLAQTWQSYRNSSHTTTASLSSSQRSCRTSSCTIFSQTTGQPPHCFANAVHHVPIRMELPPCCCGDPSKFQTNSGRTPRLSFAFAEQAIMACKAALFQDSHAYEQILACTNAADAKAWGRRVTAFDQRTWDAYQCTIVRHVLLAKLRWPLFRTTLLATGTTLIIECTKGDWVWGCALAVTDTNVYSPDRWSGLNLLGWGLMEAREVARTQQAQAQSPAPPPSSVATTTSNRTPLKRPRILEENTTKQQHPPQETTAAENTIHFLATKYILQGPNAFRRLPRTTPDQQVSPPVRADLAQAVPGIVMASCPEAQTMKGERDRKDVTRMLTDIYRYGLHMHGGPESSLNRIIIPALRYIISQVQRWDPLAPKRVVLLRNLVEAMQECQQVQARVILRIYSDLTAQTATLDSQLQYSLVHYKEAALHILITQYHAPSCDWDHTKVDPQQQRAHLMSGYLSLIGETFGLDGIEAANEDRYLSQSLNVIRDVHNGRNSSSSIGGGGGGGVGDEPLKRFLVDELKQKLCVKAWLSSLLGDINNQAAHAERLIDRSCIFAWAATNMTGNFKHRIFYDEARREEYADLEPQHPTAANQYEPFLSPVVLVEILIKMGMLTRIYVK